jgi:hypothetical protein
VILIAIAIILAAIILAPASPRCGYQPKPGGKLGKPPTGGSAIKYPGVDACTLEIQRRVEKYQADLKAATDRTNAAFAKTRKQDEE